MQTLKIVGLTASLILQAGLYTNVMANLQKSGVIEFLERQPIIVDLPMPEQSFLNLLVDEGIEYYEFAPNRFSQTDPRYYSDNASVVYAVDGGRTQDFVLQNIAYVVDGEVVFIRNDRAPIKH